MRNTKSHTITTALTLTAMTALIITGCSGGSTVFRDPVPLAVEEVELPAEEAQDNGTTEPGAEVHPIFTRELGVPISPYAAGIVDSDRSGYNIFEDFDGDGIANADETTSNEYVSEYPRIVTRIAPRITMTLVVDVNDFSKNHTEIIEDENMKQTIENSMEDRQYDEMNKKTVAYPVKESLSTEGSSSAEYGSEEASSFKTGVSVSLTGGYYMGEVGEGKSRSNNTEIANSFARSTLSERMEFKDVDFMDNLDRNGVEFTEDTIRNIISNYRTDTELKHSETIGPNAGLIRASLYIKNASVNMPVRVKNILCTLSFRTPSGAFLPVKTFRVRNDDYSLYEQDINGGQEAGPYVIELEGLNTAEIKNAMANGYVPQIHVVSYDMKKLQKNHQSFLTRFQAS